MSADGEIEAAIAKLQLLRGVGVMYPDNYECTDSDWANACNLITTLHRTIDAQLGVLKRAHTMAVTGREAILIVDMNLARAINGATS